MRLRMFFQYRSIKHHVAKCFVAQAQPAGRPRRPSFRPVNILYGNCKELVIMALSLQSHSALMPCLGFKLCIIKPYDSGSGRHI